ncbi:MAG TPA: tol-pal system-associated acyl-CoA thioesterase [Burkholderiales bacterium]|nr:tol-pal system-associated acyl-CoA thioesterase [Burkholderiales bacterium]
MQPATCGRGKVLQRKIFTWPVRVYYEDTDTGGVVYYANYLKFMERARTEWLRAQGFEQDELLREHGVIFVVRHVVVDYFKPAAFNDELEVTVEPAESGRSQITFMQSVRRGAAVLVGARVKVACVNPESFKPVKMPDAMIKALGKEP